MKSTQLACLLALAAASIASPVPQAASSTTTVVQTITVVPVAAPASPYPAGPTTNEFKYRGYDENNNDDKLKREKIHNAFAGNWAAVLQKGIQSLADTTDNTFDRWFPQNAKQGSGVKSVDGRGYVRGVWTQMLSPDATTPTPKSLIAGFVNEKDDYAGLCKPKTDAYFTINTGQFHVCDKGLQYTIEAKDVNCNDLGSFVSRKMESTTGVIIHEFHHSNQVGEKAPNSVGHITDIAYGPSNCMRLREGPKNQDTFVNADSYMWFALNAYYNDKCGKKYSDPIITAEDFDEGMAQVEDSPEYNAAAEDGIFEGV